MQIPILVEPIEGGRYRVRAGEPFALCAEGGTKAEAIRMLHELIAARIKAGAEVRMLALPSALASELPPADELYKTDPWFKEFQDAIAENRRREDAAQP
jgi:hypothetical protein